MTRADFDTAVERAAHAVFAQFPGDPPAEALAELQEIIADALRDWIEIDPD